MRGRLDQVARVWAVVSFVAWLVLLMVALGTFDASTAQGATAGDAAVDSPRLEQRRDEPQTSVDEVSRTVMCPSCDTTLDQSNSAAAERMRVWVEEAVAAGWTEEEIRDGLVEEYGGDESILATPRANSGLGILVWAVPAGIVLAALLAAVVLMRRWKGQTRSGSSSNAHSSSSSTSAVASDSSSGDAPSPSSSR